MAGQPTFNRRGPRVFPVAPQPVAESAGEVGVAGFVTVGEGATVVHTAGHPLLVGLGVVVVTLETACTGDVYQLTDDADRTWLSGVDVDDLHVVGQRAQCARRCLR